MLVDSEDLETLAETCLSTARTIKSFLASHGHQPMSFDENGPAKFPPLPADIHLARTTLQEASHRLHALASDPEEPLATGLYYQVCHRQCLSNDLIIVRSTPSMLRDMFPATELPKQYR